MQLSKSNHSIGHASPPKMTCFPSRWGAGAMRMAKSDVVVLGPVLAELTRPYRGGREDGGRGARHTSRA